MFLEFRGKRIFVWVDSRGFYVRGGFWGRVLIGKYLGVWEILKDWKINE